MANLTQNTTDLEIIIAALQSKTISPDLGIDSEQIEQALDNLHQTASEILGDM